MSKVSEVSTLSHKFCSWCWQYKKQSNYFHLTHFIGTGKSEIRISKFETNSNDQNKKTVDNAPDLFVLDFENLNFGFVSDFGFRASDLKTCELFLQNGTC